MSDNPRRYGLAICNICDNTSNISKLFYTPSHGGIIVDYLYDEVKKRGFYFNNNEELKAFNKEVSELARELYAKKYAEMI